MVDDGVAKLRPVILVGHCWPDAQLLRSAIGRAVPGATVSLANEEHVLHECMTGECVLLVNRELDGDYPLRYGVDLIKELAKRDRPPLMMLISNYADAQQHAVAAGAMQGFGKSAVYSAATAAILRDAITMRDNRQSMQTAGS